MEIKKPELQALIEDLKKNGSDLDETLFNGLTALKLTSEKPVKFQRAPGKKSLVEVFAPLRGMDLDFSRNKSTGRPVDL